MDPGFQDWGSSQDQYQYQHAPPVPQQLVPQMGMVEQPIAYPDSHHEMGQDDGGDSDDARRGSRPKERKAFIQNTQERRKYFVNRVKAIRAKAETFAKCTGQDILVLTFDEDGNAHYWGTPSFERFFNIEGVQDVLYRTLSNQVPEVEYYPQQYEDYSQVDTEQLRTWIRQKFAVGQGPEGNYIMPDYSATQAPPDWPTTVLWTDPSQLTHEQLLEVIKIAQQHREHQHQEQYQQQHMQQMSQMHSQQQDGELGPNPTLDDSASDVFTDVEFSPTKRTRRE